MAIREIPKSIEYMCDGCGRSDRKEAPHTYRHGHPDGWMIIRAHVGGRVSNPYLWCDSCTNESPLRFIWQDTPGVTEAS